MRQALRKGPHSRALELLVLPLRVQEMSAMGAGGGPLKHCTVFCGTAIGATGLVTSVRHVQHNAAEDSVEPKGNRGSNNF